MRQIDILYFDSCPGWRAAEQRVRQVLIQAGLDGAVAVRLVPVETEEDAQAHRFLGSPTVRVDGDDIDPAAAQCTAFGLQCRLYDSKGRLGGLPPTNLIRSALGLELFDSDTTEAAACCGGGPCR